MFKLTRDDFIDQVDDIITVGEFYELAAGGEIDLVPAPALRWFLSAAGRGWALFPREGSRHDAVRRP